MNVIKECPTCGGKGHVFDPGILLLPVFGWLEAVFGGSSSRETCSQCKGKGYVFWPVVSEDEK